MSTFSYPFDYLVAYDTDDEYREQLCRLFAASRPLAPDRDLEREIANQHYCDADMQFFVDHILAATENIPAMHNLYARAAGIFMSSDIGTGLVSLFAYDHFAYFHACLCSVLRKINPEDVEEYRVLSARFNA